MRNHSNFSNACANEVFTFHGQYDTKIGIWKRTLYDIDYIDAHGYSDMDVKCAGFTLMTTAAAAAAANAKTRISYRNLDCILSISVNIK